MWLFYVIAAAAWLFSLYVRRRLTGAYERWGSTRNAAGATGAQTAHAVLKANDLRHVQLVRAPGKLSDHYDPQSATIRLSEPVFGVPSVAALAIAAHETGHVLQHAEGYGPFRVRTALVPLAELGARFGLPAAVLGLFMGSSRFVQIGVLTYVGALIFQFATIPVEYNASKRARRQLENLRLVDEVDREGVREVLRAAALTYVAGVASSAGYLVFLLITAGRWLIGKPPPPPAP